MVCSIITFSSNAVICDSQEPQVVTCPSPTQLSLILHIIDETCFPFQSSKVFLGLIPLGCNICIRKIYRLGKKRKKNVHSPLEDTICIKKKKKKENTPHLKFNSVCYVQLTVMSFQFLLFQLIYKKLQLYLYCF